MFYPKEPLDKPTYVHFILKVHLCEHCLNMFTLSLNHHLNMLACDMIKYSHLSKKIRSWLVGYKWSKATIYMESLRLV